MPILTPPSAILFDLDGTLLDTAPDMALALNTLRQRHGLGELEYDPIRMTVSHGARALVSLAFNITEGEPGFEDLKQEFLAIYKENPAQHTIPFTGIEGLLDQLEHHLIPWGIVTNKPRTYAEPILDALDLANRCRSLICPDDVTKTKPDPEPLFLACQQLQCKPEHAIYVGDHIRDIEAGRNAGMITIAAAYGYIQSDDNIHNWQADFNVSHADEILALLLPALSSD